MRDFSQDRCMADLVDGVIGALLRVLGGILVLSVAGLILSAVSA